MELSPLYQTLILIEHKKSVNIEEIRSNLGTKSSKGVIGKMDAMALIQKDATGNIRLSKKGHKYLNDILANLHDSVSKWDGYWTVVSFSIPEKQRAVRDKFRRFLDNIGMKPLFNSIWVSPLHLTPAIIEYMKINNLANMVMIIKTKNIFGINIEKIVELWDFDKYRNMLNEFIEDAYKPLNSKSDKIYEAKKKVFNFALILEKQPKMPLELFPKDWPYLRSKMAYKKLRSIIR